MINMLGVQPPYCCPHGFCITDFHRMIVDASLARYGHRLRENRDLRAILSEESYQMGTDKPSPAGYEDAQRVRPLSLLTSVAVPVLPKLIGLFLRMFWTLDQGRS